MYLGNKDKYLNIRLTKNEHDKLKEISKEFNCTVSDLVRNLVDSYLTQVK